MSSPQTLMEGLQFFRNPKNGFSVLTLHYNADPAKRSPAWKEKESIGIGSTDWAREYELSWVVKVGRSVYTDFARNFHTFGPSTPRGDVKLPDDARLVIGHDLGPTASRMAASFNLFERGVPRRWTIDEVFCERGSVDEYLDQVEHLLVRWDRWPEPLHVVDPTAIENISRIEERVCADLMRMRGMSPIPGERSFIRRRKAVEDILRQQQHGAFLYNVHERCTMHIEGFEGGYHYPEVSPARGGGFGAIPVKNGFSDIHDALQYAHSVADIVFVTPSVNPNNWIKTYVTGNDARHSPSMNGTLPPNIKIGNALG